MSLFIDRLSIYIKETLRQIRDEAKYAMPGGSLRRFYDQVRREKLIRGDENAR